MDGCGRLEVKGFSLVELLIAMTLFSVGLLAVAGMQIGALRGNALANSLTVAGSLAEGVLEEILAWDSDHPLLAVDATDRTWRFDADSVTQTVDGAGTYQARYAIDTDYGEPKLTRIEVRIIRVGDPLARVTTLVGFRRRG